MRPRRLDGVRLLRAVLVAALLGGAAAESARAAPPVGMQVSGDFTLNLEKAVPVKSPAGEVSCDLELLLTCRNSVWNKTVFGFARGYNLAFQEGQVTEANTAGGAIRLGVKMTIEPEAYAQYEGSGRTVTGEYLIDLTREGYDLSGSFSGVLNRTSSRGKSEVKGKVTGAISPYWPPAAEGAVPVRKGEHPRLFFRRGDITALQQKADTPEGRKMVTRLREMLEKDKKGFYYGRDYAPAYCEGLWAAGHGFLYALTGDKAEAARAREIALLAVGRSFEAWQGNPLRVAGTAMAYDLCYDAWDDSFRNDMAAFLMERSLLARANTADSHLDAMYQAAGGLAALAVLNDPYAPSAKPLPPSEANALAPPTDFTPSANVPTFRLTGSRASKQLLVTGPFNVKGDEDPLAAVGGRAGARPEPGTKGVIGDTKYEFKPMPMVERAINLGHLARFLTGASEERPVAVSTRYAYLYTVLDNEKPRVVQAWPNPRAGAEDYGYSPPRFGVSMWLAGRQVRDGELLRLEAGKYPLMMQVALDLGAWAAPKVVEYTDDAYKSALADWQVEMDAYAAAGNTTPFAEQRLNRAAQFIRRYVSLSVGDRGFPSEQPGFADCVHLLLPFAQAYRNVTGRDLARGTGLEWEIPLAIATRGRFVQSDWGGDFWVTLGFPGLVSDQYKPALKWAIGQEEDLGTWAPTHVMFGLLNYPWNVEPKAPKDSNLPLVIEDRRSGGYVLRSGWDDAKDFTTVIVLRKDAPRSSVTAGDFSVYGRMGDARWTGASNMGSGNFWQPNLDDYERPNVTRIEGLIPTGGAKPTFFSAKPNGSAVMSMVQDHWIKGKTADGRHKIEDPADQGVQALRSIAVDYSGASGSPALFAVVDRVTGGAGREKWVQLNFSRSRGGPGGQLSAEGRNFTFVPMHGRRADPVVKANMKGTFIVPGEIKLSTDGSDKRPATMLKAAGGDAYFLIMTIQEDQAPEVKVDGTGLTARVTVGGQIIVFDGEKLVLAK